MGAAGPVDVPPADEFVTGFNSPDNVAEGPDRRHWIVEDNFGVAVFALSL